MTGEPRNANVRTLLDTELLVVGKAAFSPILDASPELVEHISPITWDNVILYGEYVLDRDAIRL